MRNHLLFFVALFGLVSVGSAQRLDTSWISTYTAGYARDVAVDDSGYVCVTGAGIDDRITTIKYRPDGGTQWVREYPLAVGVPFYGLALDDSCLYITTEGLPGTYTGRYVTLKYTKQGELRWVRVYTGDGGLNIPVGIAVDGLGNVFVAGQSDMLQSDGALRPGYATIKYYPDGDTAWVSRHISYPDYPSSGDQPVGLALDQLGNVCVSGFSHDPVHNERPFLTRKYNTNGDTLWTRRYLVDYQYNVYARSTAVDKFNNVYLLGDAMLDTTSNDLVTVKYNSNGTLLWWKPYKGPYSDQGVKVTTDAAGNAYIIGLTGNAPPGSPPYNYDYVTVKYYPDGIEAWTSVFGGSFGGDDYPTDIAIDDSGYVYVTGNSQNYVTTGSTEIATIKYSPDGDSQWVATYDRLGGESNEWGKGIAVDSLSNVYVAGHTGGGDINGYVTIKYDQYVGGDAEVTVS